MKVRIMVKVHRTDDYDNLLEFHSIPWDVPYDPQENLRGVCRELADVVEEKLIEMGQIPPTSSVALSHLDDEEVLANITMNQDVQRLNSPKSRVWSDASIELNLLYAEAARRKLTW